MPRTLSPLLKHQTAIKNGASCFWLRLVALWLQNPPFSFDFDEAREDQQRICKVRSRTGVRGESTGCAGVRSAGVAAEMLERTEVLSGCGASIRLGFALAEIWFRHWAYWAIRVLG
ncbi:Mediator of RNA polymerase II transcription subunit 17 [Gossypium arboreum]|uniref:Mediator of RNA polymerase II transcription subunit 17 n=1 Tax=Gossypium arboreum TaxID=29729 RepID=A0A0B0P345_GOSAR|nr:Mediator of RNA polymerase II transcription subunit 17 [Gossypium arboreum]